MEILMCPYEDGCVLYKAWKKHANKGQDRRDIISGTSGTSYVCLAHSVFDDNCAEGGIPIPEEIRSQFNDPAIQNNQSMGQVECSHIKQLNLLKNISDRLA